MLGAANDRVAESSKTYTDTNDGLVGTLRRGMSEQDEFGAQLERDETCPADWRPHRLETQIDSTMSGGHAEDAKGKRDAAP